MQQAYTLLMDTPSRAELDSRPQSTGTAAPGSTEQLPAEDLGAPPPTARPFSFVDKAPQPQTPAGRAGLARGDAVLRLGTGSLCRGMSTVSAHVSAQIVATTRHGVPGRVGHHVVVRVGHHQDGRVGSMVGSMGLCG